MGVFLKASVLVVLCFISLAKAQETPAPSTNNETRSPDSVPEEAQGVTLEEATKQVMQDTKNKVLAAKTELVAGKKIHVIKILTSTGHIQYIKIDAATGKPLDKPKK